MEILVQINTLRDEFPGGVNNLITEVKARRILDPNKKSNVHIDEDGRTLVREFVIELDDYSDEDVKEYEAKHHNTPRKPKFRG